MEDELRPNPRTSVVGWIGRSRRATFKQTRGSSSARAWDGNVGDKILGGTAVAGVATSLPGTSLGQCQAGSQQPRTGVTSVTPRVPPEAHNTSSAYRVVQR